MKIQPNRIERILQRTANLVTGVIHDQVDSWTSAYSVEPTSGPGQQEYRLKKMLKGHQQKFGKDSIYTLSLHHSLAEHHRGQLQGMDAATHYHKTLEIFEKELQERGEIESLHKLVPASLGGGQDAATLYEKAADFFQLYGGAEKSLPLLQRAQELLPKDASFERRTQVEQKIAEVHKNSGNTGEATKIYQKIWGEALENYGPTSSELGAHAEALARNLGEGQRSEDLWGLSISLNSNLRTAPALSSLAKQYASLGCHDQARELRNQSEILNIEDRVRGAPTTPLLRQDLLRLIELYQSKGDAGSAERAQLKLTQVETRLALKSPLTW